MLVGIYLRTRVLSSLLTGLTPRNRLSRMIFELCHDAPPNDCTRAHVKISKESSGILLAYAASINACCTHAVQEDE